MRINSKTIKIVLSFLLVFLFLNNLSSETKIRWHSFNEGYKLALAQKKPMFIDFYASWCKWCKVMEKETFNDPAIIKKVRKNFIAVRINTDSFKKNISYKKYKNITAQQFFGMIGGRGLPTILFMDSNGAFITRIPGYINARVFLPLLQYINNKCYAKNVLFDKQYISGKIKCK